MHVCEARRRDEAGCALVEEGEGMGKGSSFERYPIEGQEKRVFGLFTSSSIQESWDVTS